MKTIYFVKFKIPSKLTESMRYANPLQIRLPLMLLIVFVLSACKKKTDLPDEKSTIEIQGISYPTIKIGTQIWTVSNFKGNGGVSSEEGHTILDGQKVYSIHEARNIQLPEGWRLPTKADFEKLIRYIGETNEPTVYGSSFSELEIRPEFLMKLLAKDKWPSVNATNLSGFNIVPLIEDDSYPAEHIIATDIWCADAGRCHFDVSMLMNTLETLSGVLFYSSAGEGAGDRKAIRFVKDI